MSFRAGPPREIVHLNVIDFAVAVERVVERRLEGRPVIVGVPGAARARVLDMSQEAYLAGIRRRMPLERALKTCRDARLVAPRPELYQRAMAALAKLGYRFSPLVEAGSADGHLYLDLSGTGRLLGPARDAAWRLFRQSKEELRLEPVWSMAPNKLVAKAASRLVKPKGELVVAPGEEEAFLRPLPLDILPGLERDLLAAFKELNLSLIGQLAQWSPAQLETFAGRRGLELHGRVRGRDDSPVCPLGERPPRVRVEYELAEDSNHKAEVEALLWLLAEQAGAELRGRELLARQVAVFLDYSDGVRVIRQRSDKRGANLDASLYKLAWTALNLAWKRRTRIRRLALVCDRLIPPPGQLELFPEEEDQNRRDDSLQSALGRIRSRFGARAVNLGRAVPKARQAA